MSKPLRILWIEDRPEQVKYHIQRLRVDGHDVQTSPSGEDAIESLREASETGTPFDVVLLDIMLPKGEGVRIGPDTRPELMGEEILRQVAAMGLAVPFVGVSAIADEPLRNRLTRDYHFVDAVLKKPVGMDELVEAMYDAIKALQANEEAKP